MVFFSADAFKKYKLRNCRLQAQWECARSTLTASLHSGLTITCLTPTTKDRRRPAVPSHHRPSPEHCQTSSGVYLRRWTSHIGRRHVYCTWRESIENCPPQRVIRQTPTRGQKKNGGCWRSLVSLVVAPHTLSCEAIRGILQSLLEGVPL